jgi:hypothetical protein
MPAPRRLYVHVGLQKTGTSYLQAVMLANRDELAEQGLDLVPPTKRESFDLMVVVRDRYRQRRTPASDRATLGRFAEQLAAAPGPRALLSQESLAAARPAQVRRLLEACGDREVHVVATVRDLARQLPSSWQQELKAGGTMGYADYLGMLQELERDRSGSHPWIHLDPPAVLGRWAAALSPDRVHVVTVPPAGADPTSLLERFCRVLDLDHRRLRPEERPANTSLGRVQAEVLLRVNRELPETVHRRDVYGDVGKRFFAARVLGDQPPSRIQVPADLRDWCDRVTERQLGELGSAGYDVVGDLEELRCPDAAFSDDEGDPTGDEVAGAAVTAIARMLTLRADGRARGPQRPGRVTSLRGWLGRLRGADSHISAALRPLRRR